MSLYELLGVDRNSDASQIKKAFHKKAMKCHPDTGGDAEEFRKIQHAHDILSDPVRRQRYDDTGDESEAKPDNSHIALMTLLSSAFDTVLKKVEKDKLDPTQIDLRLLMVEFLSFAADEMRQLIVRTQKEKAKLERILGRFTTADEGQNLLELIVDSKIKKFDLDIAQMESAIEMNCKAREVLHGYEYRVDSMTFDTLHEVLQNYLNTQ